MQTRHLGTTEIAITPIVMGTWQAGKRMWVGIDDSQIEKALCAALDAGIATFDTAEMYGFGHSERAIARALGQRRDEIVILDKVSPQNLSYGQVLKACERSLRALGTDRIDLYQVHWPPGTFNSKAVPLEEPLRAMVELKQQGKIRAIGVSNFNAQQLRQAMAFTTIDALQPPYSLFWRQMEQELMPLAQEHQVTILAYSPLAQGVLTGKFGPDHVFAEGDHRRGNRLFQAEHYQRVQEAISALRPVAERLGISLTQLALAWLIAQPLTCAVVGVRNAEQILGAVAAAEVALAPEDLKEIEAIGRGVTDHLDDNPLLWQM